MERIFIAVHQKVDGKTVMILKEGKEGKGLTLPYHCAFCKEHGVIKAAFRTQRERNHHAHRCPT